MCACVCISQSKRQGREELLLCVLFLYKFNPVAEVHEKFFVNHRRADDKNLSFEREESETHPLIPLDFDAFRVLFFSRNTTFDA